MSRISQGALVTAIRKVQAMDFDAKQELAAEILSAQPHMLTVLAAQHQLGVSFPKLDFLLEILLVCFQAMKESKLAWPLITEDEQERQVSRYSAHIRSIEGKSVMAQTKQLTDYIDAHPEKQLLAYVYFETSNWLKAIDPEDSDKFVLMAAINYVDCIAYVPLPDPKDAVRWIPSGPRRRR